MNYEYSVDILTHHCAARTLWLADFLWWPPAEWCHFLRPHSSPAASLWRRGGPGSYRRLWRILDVDERSGTRWGTRWGMWNISCSQSSLSALNFKAPDSCCFISSVFHTFDRKPDLRYEGGFFFLHSLWFSKVSEIKGTLSALQADTERYHKNCQTTDLS